MNFVRHKTLKERREQHGGWRKRYRSKIMKDPERYATYLADQRRQKKEWRETIKREDPQRFRKMLLRKARRHICWKLHRRTGEDLLALFQRWDCQ